MWSRQTLSVTKPLSAPSALPLRLKFWLGDAPRIYEKKVSEMEGESALCGTKSWTLRVWEMFSKPMAKQRTSLMSCSSQSILEKVTSVKPQNVKRGRLRNCRVQLCCSGPKYSSSDLHWKQVCQSCISLAAEQKHWFLHLWFHRLWTKLFTFCNAYSAVPNSCKITYVYITGSVTKCRLDLSTAVPSARIEVTLHFSQLECRAFNQQYMHAS